jgi:(2Fe-2S) ferredoxin
LSERFEDDRPAWLRDLEPQSRYRVHVCFGKNCTPNGAEAVFAAFQTALAAAGIRDVELIATSCRSRCELGPSVNVYPGPVTYGQMNPERAYRVVVEHLSGPETPVREFVVTEDEVQRAKRNAAL